MNCWLMSMQRLQAKILKLVDISYGGENGFNQAIELSAEVLTNVKFIQEKKLIGTCIQYSWSVVNLHECLLWYLSWVLECLSGIDMIHPACHIDNIEDPFSQDDTLMRSARIQGSTALGWKTHWKPWKWVLLRFWLSTRTWIPWDTSYDATEQRDLLWWRRVQVCKWCAPYTKCIQLRDSGLNMSLFLAPCLFCSTSSSTDPDEKTLYLTPEQEKDKSHFTDKEVSEKFFP